MPYLILVRHGQSEWNKLGLWTGHTDVSITKQGAGEARQAAESIKHIEIHSAHVSGLKRTHQTFKEIEKFLGKNIGFKAHPALNERHYGIHTGKNKWQIKEELGPEMFQKIRRHWNMPIPGGETLKDVHDRVLPYYKENIHPELIQGKNVLVVSHGNTIRALIKHLENISDEAIADIELQTGEAYCYNFNSLGEIISKEVRNSV